MDIAVARLQSVLGTDRLSAPALAVFLHPFVDDSLTWADVLTISSALAPSTPGSFFGQLVGRLRSYLSSCIHALLLFYTYMLI